MQGVEGQGTGAARTVEMDDRVQGRQGDAHVGRMRRDARVRGTEDGMDAVEPLARVTARARCPLVAARSVGIVEIGASRPLEQIAADRRHVADLRRCTGQDRARQHRIALAHQPVLGQRGVADRRADQQPAALGLDDLGGQSGHVDQTGRRRDPLAHQIDDVGATAEIGRLGNGPQAQGLRPVGGAGIVEGGHAATVARIASMIPLCAPHRHKLPLIRS